jgi:hypothetical protein
LRELRAITRLQDSAEVSVTEASAGDSVAVQLPTLKRVMFLFCPPSQEAFMVRVNPLLATKLPNERVTTATPAGGKHVEPLASSFRLPSSVGSDKQSPGESRHS